ncbi:MAG: hypothetical protein MUE37_12600 [Bacteroidales bacterium]|jgi:hypothetical protein|nr:hypothetical protein [Bacteroidales bacterium]
MKRVYLKDRAELIRRTRKGATKLITDELVSGLPEPFKKYLRICGYLNTPLPLNGDVYWSESFLKLSPDREWGELKTIQFNSVDPIGRVAYMKFLKMPVAGRDIYRDGYGEMKGRLLGLFRVIFDNSRETAQSALLTTFCEFLLVPGYLFSDNVSWSMTDNRTVLGSLTDNGIRATAIFRFGEDGLLTSVETSDRYYTEGKGEYKKVKFSAVVESYKRQGEIMFPEKMKAVWHLPGGDYEYFKGTISRIEYNVTD